MSFASSLREAHTEESKKHAAALTRDLWANGVPSAGDLSKLWLLRQRYPISEAMFEDVLEKLRAGKP